MDIIITGRSALTLHRAMREPYPLLRGMEVPTSSVAPSKLEAAVLRRLSFGALEHLGLHTTDRPLDLSVGRASDRVSLPQFACHVRNARLPGGSFVQVKPTRRSPGELPDTSSCRILVDSIPLTVVSEARFLQEHVGQGGVSRQDATVLLTRLICELCGSYGRDAANPMGAEPLYELRPACDVATIRAYLDGLHGVRGLELARAAARQACDGLASPMEFLIYAVLALPPRLGGLHLRDVRVNEAYRLEKDELAGLGIMRLTPDFRFGEKPIALEYQGSEHLEKYRVRKDKVRAQAYAMLGVRQYPIMIDDVSTIGALDQTLHDIVDLLSPYEGSSYRKRALSVLRDERCLRARARLLELCLRRYGAGIVWY